MSSPRSHRCPSRKPRRIRPCLEPLEDRCLLSASMVLNINSATNAGSDPFNLTNVGGTLFFTADDGTHHSDLWKSDGTAAGTAQVTSDHFAGYPQQLTASGGQLYFVDVDNAEGGLTYIGRSDGTAAGTQDILQTIGMDAVGSPMAVSCGGATAPPQGP